MQKNIYINRSDDTALATQSFLSQLSNHLRKNQLVSYDRLLENRKD